MSVIKMEEATGLGSAPLADALEDLADAQWLAQARAMAVERQSVVAPHIPELAAGSRLAERQQALRGLATRFLNEIAPETISSLVAAEGFIALLHASRGMLDGEDADAILAALGERAAEVRTGIAEVARRTARAVQEAEPVQRALEAELAAAAKAIGDGGSGEIQRLSGEIASTSKAMSATVQLAVTAGEKVAKGAGKLANWFVSLFKFGTDDAKAPATDKGKDAPADKPRAPASGGSGHNGGEATAMDKPAATPSGDRPAPAKAADTMATKADKPVPAAKTDASAAPKEDFPLETVGEIGNAAAGSVDARAELGRLADAQRALYLELHRLEAGAAIVQAVRQQGEELAAALRAVEGAARAVGAEWLRISAACDRAPGAARPRFAADWNHVHARLALLRNRLAGA